MSFILLGLLAAAGVDPKIVVAIAVVAASIIYYRSRPGASGFGFRSTSIDVVRDTLRRGTDTRKKTALVTGAAAGLGLETAACLAAIGYDVLLPCRNAKRAAEAAELVGARAFDVRAELLGGDESTGRQEEPSAIRKGVGRIVPGVADLASIKSVIEYAGDVKVPALDAVVLNAGIMGPRSRLVSADGIELQMAVNHVAHQALCEALMPQIMAAKDGCRVVTVSSSAHRRTVAPALWAGSRTLEGPGSYHPMNFYGKSKFANILFARELHERFASRGVVSISLHPGVIFTDLWKNFPSWFSAVVRGLDRMLRILTVSKSVEAGAATTLFAAAHPKAATLGGEFLTDANVTTPRLKSEVVEDSELRAGFFDISHDIIAKVLKN